MDSTSPPKNRTALPPDFLFNKQLFPFHRTRICTEKLTAFPTTVIQCFSGQMGRISPRFQHKCSKAKLYKNIIFFSDWCELEISTLNVSKCCWEKWTVFAHAVYSKYYLWNCPKICPLKMNSIFPCLAASILKSNAMNMFWAKWTASPPCVALMFYARIPPQKCWATWIAFSVHWIRKTHWKTVFANWKCNLYPPKYVFEKSSDKTIYEKHGQYVSWFEPKVCNFNFPMLKRNIDSVSIVGTTPVTGAPPEPRLKLGSKPALVGWIQKGSIGDALTTSWLTVFYQQSNNHIIQRVEWPHFQKDCCQICGNIILTCIVVPGTWIEPLIRQILNDCTRHYISWFIEHAISKRQSI